MDAVLEKDEEYKKINKYRSNDIMAVKYGKFEMPKMIKIDEETKTKMFTRFIAEPLKEVLVILWATFFAVFYSIH